MGYSKLKNSGKVRDYRKGSLKERSLTFIREYCKDLNFDNEKASEEKENGVLLGTSLSKNQIPYNMEQDINRLCFERAIERFLKSGKKQDAFDVYFCYLEIFLKDYKKVRHIIELLSEYEANGSGLLMKHRDHYSHSVYVFCLGLAIYVSSPLYREIYSKVYENEINDKNEAGCHFLKYWGLSSLFHDIGYPFELPFEQVCSYFEVNKEKRGDNPYVSYEALDRFVEFGSKEKQKVEKVITDRSFSNINELWAYELKKRLGEVYKIDEKQIVGYLKMKPEDPDEFDYFMDHAYFSSAVLFERLFVDMDLELDQAYLDSLTAILMHNSLYKFCIANPNMNPKKEGKHLSYKDEGNIPFSIECHPLAYMLMLCDELQCWDRTAYGRNSKLEFHPMHCRFFFEENIIKTQYIYDIKGEGKIDTYKKDLKDYYAKVLPEYEKNLKEWNEKYGELKEADGRKKPEEPEKPKLKAYSSMCLNELRNGETEKISGFQSDIEKILNLTDIKLEVEVKLEERTKRNGNLSESNFMNLYDFGAALNARWAGKTISKKEQLEQFEGLSLEYKLSNINQAKSFSRYLEVLNAFFTNKEVDFEMIEEFSEDELKLIGPLEHRRWLREHFDMGWGYISEKELAGLVKKETGIEDEGSKEFKTKLKAKRENLRLHPDMCSTYDYMNDYDDKRGDSDEFIKQSEANYKILGKEIQDLDTLPMITMLNLLEEYEGLRIYRLS